MTAERMTALLQRLDAELRAGRSATLVLERWCGHPVSARRTASSAKVLPDEHKRRLALMPHECLAYRRVQLVADGHVLCEADNWYVPDRLTATMNGALEATDTPFGKVVAPLRPSRRALSTRMLWHQTQSIGQTTSHASDDGGACPVLEHQALLIDAVGRALSLVHEIYMTGLLTLQRTPPLLYSPLQASP